MYLTYPSKNERLQGQNLAGSSNSAVGLNIFLIRWATFETHHGEGRLRA